MSMYEPLARLAARLGPQHARRMAALALRLGGITGKTALPAHRNIKVMGLEFAGPVGLAAGFDKHGELYPYLGPLGFGFAEIGTATPRPEPARSRGIIAVSNTLARHAHRRTIPVGISISMNRNSAPENFVQDYQTCMHAAWDSADYLVLNLGIRKGPDLHQPQYRAVLGAVFAAARAEQAHLTRQHRCRKPILVKIDQTRDDTQALIGMACDANLDGIVLGGEGAKVPYLLEQTVRSLSGLMPVISVGGIRTPRDALDRLDAGAALVQLHTGLVESGPGLVKGINALWAQRSG